MNNTKQTHRPVSRFGTMGSRILAISCALAGISSLIQVQSQAQTTLAAASRVTADTSKPGFVWRIFANQANQVNSTARTEDALSGQLKDTDGNPLPNLADPSAQGVALDVAAAPSPENGVIEFLIEGVINLNKNDGGANGNFDSDGLMPGTPATDGSANGLAAEIITYLDLPAGEITMGVNSDDGFSTAAGTLHDYFLRSNLGAFEGGRGANDTIFKFVVPQAGVYPFRTTYEQGGGDANIEWFTVKGDGTKVLVNDTANGGLKAYRQASLKPKDPYIANITPGNGLRQLNKQGNTFSVVLNDGDNEAIDDATIDLKVDGKAVTSKQRTGKQVVLTYTFDGIQFPLDSHAATLTYKGTKGYTRTENWSFMNIKNTVLPNPVITENFDSYAEGTQPTGWVATNFTAPCDETEEITNQKSPYYMNWVVISKDTMPSIDDAGLDAVNPTEKVNGTPLTIDMLRSGNVLYAESDSRCNGEGRQTVLDSKTGVWGQTQFIVTKPYNLSAVKDPVISFSSGYMQNQDSYGGVEYSVDGGKTWLPVVYFLDVPDIAVRPDGSADGVATFTAVQGDTSVWADDQGNVKGERYGDAVAATIDDSIGKYIAPRVNDDGTEGKRVEIFRLPAAAQKSDVRLRLSATGSDSWYFWVDNIAFYDVPSSVTPTTPISNFKAAASGSNVVLTWEGGAGPFVVQTATTLGGAWTDSAPSSNRTATIPAATGAGFFRILDQGGKQ